MSFSISATLRERKVAEMENDIHLRSVELQKIEVELNNDKQKLQKLSEVYANDELTLRDRKIACVERENKADVREKELAEMLEQYMALQTVDLVFKEMSNLIMKIEKETGVVYSNEISKIESLLYNSKRVVDGQK